MISLKSGDVAETKLTCARENPTSFRVPHTLHFQSLAIWGGMLAMRNVGAAWLHLALIILFMSQSALAKEACDAQSMKGDLCLCELSKLHPTQASVGMTEVWIKAEKLRDELHRRGERKFFKYLLKHDKEEPVIIGPRGVFYITDHHHLARALYDIGELHTYCIIIDNLSGESVDDFWRGMSSRFTFGGPEGRDEPSWLHRDNFMRLRMSAPRPLTNHVVFAARTH